VVWFPTRPVWQAAMAAGLLVGGILFGRYLPQAGGSNTEMAELRGQVENLHQMVALSMLQAAVAQRTHARGNLQREDRATGSAGCSTPCCRQ